jgi:branched-chain amino acid transport system ATP-binding protein
MEAVLGATWIQFVFLTVIVFGGGAMMMGRALAETWRPVGQCVAYGLLLGVANRLFGNFFFAQSVLSVSGYIVGTAVLIAIALVAYRITRVRKMVLQYPWLYRRESLFSWREIS